MPLRQQAPLSAAPRVRDSGRGTSPDVPQFKQLTGAGAFVAAGILPSVGAQGPVLTPQQLANACRDLVQKAHLSDARDLTLRAATHLFGLTAAGEQQWAFNRDTVPSLTAESVASLRVDLEGLQLSKYAVQRVIDRDLSAEQPEAGEVRADVYNMTSLVCHNACVLGANIGDIASYLGGAYLEEVGGSPAPGLPLMARLPSPLTPGDGAELGGSGGSEEEESPPREGAVFGSV